MKKIIMVTCSVVLVAAIFSSYAQAGTKQLSMAQLRDKIAGGWAGKMVGVSYGAPTEFRARGETYEKELPWEPGMVENSLHQDDMYVQMSFMMTMDRYGMDAPAEKFAESFANAGYRLWHANVQARKNFWDGIMPPESGSPEYSLHADDIDFQIEADYIGLMCPGMPQTANKFADKVGHIMNYGDGVYGGMFVAGLYTMAYIEDDIQTIVKKALRTIPKKSGYAEAIRDVIDLHAKYPKNWRAAWAELEAKWGNVDICGALDPFNIDATINGAYIVMGLLYGEGDFGKTLEISTRCGQDSDCNPSNAAAVVGVIKGYNNIPEKWTAGIAPLADSIFIFTNYSFNSVVENTLKYAKQLIEENGGKVTADAVTIPVEAPKAPPLEVSFPTSFPIYRSSALDGSGWDWKGDWETLHVKQWGSENEVPVAKFTDERGAEVTFTFSGSGVVLNGNWAQDGGKADVYVDGKLHRNVDTYYWWAGEGKNGAFLWHVLNLTPGKHTVRLVVTGEKKPEATGSRIYVRSATVFTSIKS